MKLLSRKVLLASVQRRRFLQLAAINIAAFSLPACRNSKSVGFALGDRFPDIMLPALEGHITPSPSVVYRDVSLIINFWATWCEPCRREMPSLEKLSTFFSQKDIVVIGVSVDSDQNLAREFSLRYKFTIPMLSDSNQALSNGILRIPVFPVTYLLRRDHTIARIIVGARDWADPVMVDEIEGLLAVQRKE